MFAVRSGSACVAQITLEPAPGVPELCDFCLQRKGEHGRYLFHNAMQTESICNFCVTTLHREMMQIEFLRYSPTGTKQ